MAEHVLITGGAGFVGSHLADALATAGHEWFSYRQSRTPVHGGDDASRVSRSVNIDLERGDIRDPGALAPLLREADVVFHLAVRSALATCTSPPIYRRQCHGHGDVASVTLATERARLQCASSWSPHRCRSMAKVHTPVTHAVGFHRAALDRTSRGWLCGDGVQRAGRSCGPCRPMKTSRQPRHLFTRSPKRPHEEMAPGVRPCLRSARRRCGFSISMGSRQLLSATLAIVVAAIFSGRMLGRPGADDL